LLNRQELYDTFDSYVHLRILYLTLSLLATASASDDPDMTCVPCRLVRESDAFMYPGHLTDLVKAGRWEDAFRYISRFLPSDRLISLHGRTLLHFLRVHKAIDDIIAGAPESHAVSAALRKCFSMEFVRSSAITKLRAMLWSLLCYRGCRYITTTIFCTPSSLSVY
jgi:hypothetical protein